MDPHWPYRLSAVPQTLHARLEIASAIRTLMAQDADALAQRRTEIAAIRRQCEALKRDIHKAGQEWLALIKTELRSELKKYSPDQPRVPTGNPDGGQWTKSDGEGASPSDAADAVRDGAAMRTRYAALNTGALTDETAGGEQSSSSGDPHWQTVASENVQLVNDIPPRVDLTATIQRLIATGHITEEEAAELQQSGNAFKALDDARLMAAIEGITVREAQSVLSAQEFAGLRAAYLAGQERIVSIGGRTIQYEPNIPPYISAMTNFKGNGFSMGPGAFATPQETQATVLQELYRLNTTEAGVVGVHSGESTAVETAAARAFAEKVLQSGVMGQ
jgi:hypothetical protein